MCLIGEPTIFLSVSSVVDCLTSVSVTVRHIARLVGYGSGSHGQTPQVAKAVSHRHRCRQSSGGNGAGKGIPWVGETGPPHRRPLVSVLRQDRAPALHPAALRCRGARESDRRFRRDPSRTACPGRALLRDRPRRAPLPDRERQKHRSYPDRLGVGSINPGRRPGPIHQVLT